MSITVIVVVGSMTGKWVEVEAPANIALIKYWGKRDEDLILPLNDSVSLTINSLRAKTRVEVVTGGEDSVKINENPIKANQGTRFARCFDEVRRLLRKRKHSDEEEKGNGDSNPTNVSFKVSSTTNFPVAAGLASSAAGFAAIAFALGQLFGLNDVEVSRIARIGSGSACRSVGEGLVHWHAGSDPSGLDCYSETVVAQSQWPELRSVILVLNEAEKETSSTIGMRNTASTSTLMTERTATVVPKRVKELIDAYKSCDFEKLAGIIMADSNQFHAVCMDTMPPLRYMNDASWEVVRFVHDFNQERIRAAYTFDAGPNACVFLSQTDLPDFLSAVCGRFNVAEEVVDRLVGEGLVTKKEKKGPGAIVRNVIVSEVGDGPRVVCASCS